MRAGHRDGPCRLRHEAERLKIRHLGNTHFFRANTLGVVTPYRIAVDEEFRIRGDVAPVVTDGDRNPLLREQCCRRRFFAVGTAHRSPLMCKQLCKRRHADASDPDHIDVLRYFHRFEINERNWSLRSYSFLKIPNEAKAGLKSIVFELFASATLTASSRMVSSVNGTFSFLSNSIKRAEPLYSKCVSTIRCDTRFFISPTSSSSESPFSEPPAMSVMSSPSARKAAIVASGVVALLSFYIFTPFFSPTSCRRPSTPSNDSTPARICSELSPSESSAEAASAAF